MERQSQRALEDATRARELALVAIGTEERQRVGADLRLDPLGAQLGEHPVAIVDLEDVGLPAVDVAVVSPRQQQRQVRQARGVTVGDPRPRRESARRGVAPEGCRPRRGCPRGGS